MPQKQGKGQHYMPGQEFYCGPCSDTRIDYPKPSRPTRTMPGSKARVEVLAARVERGESLWHDEDLTGRETYHGWVIPTTGDPRDARRRVSDDDPMPYSEGV